MDMIFQALGKLFRRYPPFGGWLSFLLLVAVVVCVVSSFLVANWVPEDNIVAYTATAGLLLGAVLAHRRQTPAWFAWLLIILYCLALAILFLAHLYPGDFLRFTETRPFAVMVRQNLSLFADRTAGWWLAVSRGDSSEETVTFALGLGFLAGLLAAYAAWSTYRQRIPLAGLSILGMALALNGYFAGNSEHIWFLGLFLAATVLLVANNHYAGQEASWTSARLDYSGEIRPELLLTACGLAVVLVLSAFILPAINIRAIAETFRRSEPVTEAEQTLERVFAGVRAPASQANPSGPGGAGILPRAFLLGNAPELYETVVMTATVSPPVGLHWRAISYDVYTGRGWARSEERIETYPAAALLPVPTFASQITVTQQVRWRLDARLARYSIGEPVQFDQEVTAAWRGIDDLVRVNGADAYYEVVSRHSPANPAVLRGVANTNAPAALLARYTALPDSVPGRVLDLAQEITAGQSNDYDKATAIERFLRQYPYDLEVTGPPDGQDPVEYFLFDLQRGYCDFYASSMVVLARAAGLPARLAIGYLAQPPDDQGVQTVYQINAHSWAEVYFAGHGWVEFEPTAPFPASDAQQPAALGDTAVETPPETPPPAPPPIPEPAGETVNPLWAIPLIALLVAGFYLYTRRLERDRPEPKTVWQAYDRLQKAAADLDTATRTTQTPAEFETALLNRVDQLAEHPRPGKWLAETRPGIQAIASAYAARRYSPQKEDPEGDRRLWRTWQRMRRSLWLSGRWLALRRWLNIG